MYLTYIRNNTHSSILLLLLLEFGGLVFKLDVVKQSHQRRFKFSNNARGKNKYVL